MCVIQKNVKTSSNIAKDSSYLSSKSKGLGSEVCYYTYW